MITIRDLMCLLERSGFQIMLNAQGLREATHPRLPPLLVLLRNEPDVMAQWTEIEIVIRALLQLDQSLLTPPLPTSEGSIGKRVPPLFAGAAAGMLAMSFVFDMHVAYKQGPPPPPSIPLGAPQPQEPELATNIPQCPQPARKKKLNGTRSEAPNTQTFVSVDVYGSLTPPIKLVPEAKAEPDIHEAQATPPMSPAEAKAKQGRQTSDLRRMLAGGQR